MTEIVQKFERQLKPSSTLLPDPSLEQQVGIALQANASFQEAFKGVALPAEAVDDGGS